MIHAENGEIMSDKKNNEADLYCIIRCCEEHLDMSDDTIMLIVAGALAKVDPQDLKKFL